MHLLFLAILASTASSFSIVPAAAVVPRNGDRNTLGHQPNVIGARITHGISSRTQTSDTALPLASTIISAIPVMSTTDIVRTFIGCILAQRIANSGLKKKSLSKSGALSAFVVASFSLATSWRNGITLLAFYWTSSKLTRVGAKIKGKLEEGATEGGERGM